LKPADERPRSEFAQDTLIAHNDAANRLAQSASLRARA